MGVPGGIFHAEFMRYISDAEQTLTPGDIKNHDWRRVPDTTGYKREGAVPSGKKEPVENCGFCIHCREFGIGTTFVKSPSLAYCTKCRVTERVDLTKVTAVKCADRQGEGFHSITSIIS